MKCFVEIILISLIFHINSSNNFIGKNMIKDTLFKFEKISVNHRKLDDDYSDSTFPSDDISDEPTSDISDVTTEASETTVPGANEVSGKNSTELLYPKLLFGIDNYSFISNIIKFYAHLRFYDSDEIEPPKFTLKLIRNKNLRFLEDFSVAFPECILINNGYKDSTYKYECTANNVTDNFDKVQAILNSTGIKMTAYANNTIYDLQNQKGNRISDKGFVIIDDCILIPGEDNNTYIIKGNNDTLFDNNKLFLYVIDDNYKEINLSSEINYTNNAVEIKFAPKGNVKAKLNGTLGIIENDKNVFLLFDGEDHLNHTAKSNDIFQNKRKEKGLSGGAIVGIILPCIAVLLAVTAVAYIIGKKSPVPPTQNVGNNTIGINSSTNVVN